MYVFKYIEVFVLYREFFILSYSKEGQLSHEEAKIAKQNFIKLTQQNTQLLKEEVYTLRSTLYNTMMLTFGAV